MDPRPPNSNPFDGIDDDLATLDELSVRDQVPVFTRIHASLTTALATTAASAEGGPGPAGQAGQQHRAGHQSPGHQGPGQNRPGQNRPGQQQSPPGRR